MSLLHIIVVVGGHCCSYLMTPSEEDVAHQGAFYSEVKKPQALSEETHHTFKIRNAKFKNLSA